MIYDDTHDEDEDSYPPEDPKALESDCFPEVEWYHSLGEPSVWAS